MTEHALIGFSGTDQPSASIYDTCIRCGLCLPSCPTYLETMTETSGPRGRISLIKAVSESRLDLRSAGFVEQMWQCLDCRACEAVCPSGVHYGQLVETARAQIRRDEAPAEPARSRAVRRFLLRDALRTPRLHAPRRNAAALRAANAPDLHWPVSFGLGRAAQARTKDTEQRSSSRAISVSKRPQPQGVAFLHAGCIMSVAFAKSIARRCACCAAPA